MNFEVVGVRPRGRPKKTWMEEVKKDMSSLKLDRADAQDMKLWRSKIMGGRG